LVGEQIGSYSYRLANPTGLSDTLGYVPEDAYNYLYPYLCVDAMAMTAYQLDVPPAGHSLTWPYDPQRDLDGVPP
jgi:hypothetical protein